MSADLIQIITDQNERIGRLIDAFTLLGERMNRQAEAIGVLGGAVHALADALACAVDPEASDTQPPEIEQAPRKYMDGSTY